MANKIHITPNKPLFVALVDPAGEWDGEHRQFAYQTTAGESLILPPPAAEKLFYLSPAAGEMIRIEKVWSGLPADPPTWEFSRAIEGQEGPKAPGRPAAPETGTPSPRTILQAPTPISRPARNEHPQPEQPELFSRGTGTYGPRPRPAPRSSNRPAGPQIPANIAVKEILEFINADPNTRNWSGDVIQDLVSTVLIAAYKAGQIGLWERDE
jgi:hypothetical protein